jgi:DNA polymerase-3 subunit beta
MITVQTSTLKALLRFAATKDVRYYLTGICIEPQGYAVATDGHTLMAARIPSFNGQSFIVPTATVKAALSINKRMAHIDVSASVMGGINYTPIDGRFPDWRRVVPTQLSGELAQFDADYLGRCKAALIDLGVSKMKSAAAPITHNGSGPGIVMSPHRLDVLMVVMPVRADGCAGAPDVAAFMRADEPMSIAA